MRQVRLLPVVIAATAALLLLKGLGIVTDGGYVFVGTEQAQAQTTEGDDMLGGAGAASNLQLPAEQTLTDTSPTLDDGAPTMPLQERPAGAIDDHAGADTAVQTAAVSEAAGSVEPSVAVIPDISEDPIEAPTESVAQLECPPGTMRRFSGPEDGSGGGEAECVVDPGVNASGDALPLILDRQGNVVPLANADGTVPSSDAIGERLNARRLELDERELELEMRLALVEAAEKRIGERTAVLEHLEARINAMVDEKRTLEEAQFTAVVAMYETMRPRDAAAIFDQLEMPVLLRVSRAINPRKMAPIMAAMSPVKAKDLTAGLAVDQVEPTISLSEENLAQLPQILGQ